MNRRRDDEARHAVWQDELAWDHTAVARAAETHAQTHGAPQHTRSAMAEALHAIRGMERRLRQDPTLRRETPADLVLEAVADGVARAGRIARQSRELARQGRGDDRGLER